MNIDQHIPLHGTDPSGSTPPPPMLLPNPGAASAAAVADLVAQHQHAAALAAHAHAAALHAHAANHAAQAQQHAVHEASMVAAAAAASHGLGGSVTPSGGGNGSGRTPRKHFTFEEKKQFVAAYLGTNDTLRKFCEAHGLSLTTFHSWVKAFGGSTEAAYPPLLSGDHDGVSNATLSSAASGAHLGMLLSPVPGGAGQGGGGGMMAPRPAASQQQMQQIMDETGASAASKRARSNRFEKVERAVVEFINSKSAEERSMITYDILKNVASEVADRVLDDERRASFKISNGWIHGVLSRNHVVLEGGSAAAMAVPPGSANAAMQQQAPRIKRDLSGALKQVTGLDASGGDLQLLGVSPTAASSSASSVAVAVGGGPLQCDEEALVLIDRLADYMRTRKVDDALVLELDAFRAAFIAHTIASQSKLV